MSTRNFLIIHLFFFAVVAIFSESPWPYLMLTVAQLIYIPFTLRLIRIKEDWFFKYYYYFAIPAYLAVAWLQIFPTSKWDGLLAGIYLTFTLVIASYGFLRFLSRGFTNLEEFSIDLGLIYIALGGAWFFAFEAGLNTGFTPLITWLTAIHFHYSAFILPIFIGFLGRIYKPLFYKWIAIILLISPMVVAIGITFSRWIELLSVVLYIIGLYGLIYLTWKAPRSNKIQKWLVRISFSALGVTIVFSLLYALGNGFGLTSVTINFMLLFHGVLNCLLFALIGLLGWSLSVPPPSFSHPTFPVSRIRNRFGSDGPSNYRGLVDEMGAYEPSVNSAMLSSRILDFYKNTADYRLFATVKWKTWFKPFAFLYRMISRKTQQIHLPFHNKEIEMTGSIFDVPEGLDGRVNVRGWLRKIDEEIAFTALYSSHEHEGRTYMNIALPLPFLTMTGILELHSIGDHLQLTSKKISSPESDAGIYLSAGMNHLFKLPIEEEFIVREIKNETLIAQHKMWIFSLPFLSIDYLIYPKK